MNARTSSASRLRGGTAMAAALVLLGGAGPAFAQGFNGAISSSTNVIVNSPTSLSVTAGEAVINWNATATSAADTNINFLPTGQTVTFDDGVSSGLGDFTVLNRVTPTFGGAPIAATISFSGTVASTVGGQQGGNVWFYSPYGIIANAGSQFNVGGLLLTTSDIELGAGGALYLDQTNGNKIGFLQAGQPGSFVRINPGASINAANLSVNNAYVGLFAPRIEQGGTIRSDGMTALVAAEAGTITFNAGLVDVAVSVGTSDGQGIVHTGSTGGAASLDGESKTVAMVAVPKNTALTMLLQGNIGYDAAAAGITDGAAVELYAGSTVQADADRPDAAHLTVTAPAADTTGNITIRNAGFGSRLDALATGKISVDPVYGGINAPGYVDFAQTARLVAGGSIEMTADAAETITAQDSLFLAPLFKRAGENVTIKVAGDTVGTLAPGQIDITNLFSVDASGVPDLGNPTLAVTGANGQGGAVLIDVSQGALTAGQGFDVVADGLGTDGTDVGGTGRGGSIDIGVSNKGTIGGPGLFLSAVGNGGNSFGSGAVSTGGDGVGGLVSLHDNGGTIRTADVYIQSRGVGGTGTVTTGSATGGRAAVLIAGQTQNWNSLFVDAGAIGGDPQSTTTLFGSATGLANGIDVTVSGSGALNLTTLSLDNGAYTNAGSTQAHAATAGGIGVTAAAGGALTVTDTLSASADANLPIDVFPGAGNVAPAMTAGQVAIVADGGTISAGNLVASASAHGIAALVTGATARGGTASAGAANGGTLGVTGAFEVRAEAFGAVGPAPANALGGTARVFAAGGTVNVPQGLVISASALSGGYSYGGSLSGTGFDATGGTALLEVLGAGSSLTTGDVRLYAKGEATLVTGTQPNGAGDIPGFTSADIAGIDGNGGTGTGGTAQIRVTGGTLDAAKLTVQAYGLGGASAMSGGAAAWQSGAGVGGQALYSQSGGTVTMADLALGANGLGGGLVGAADPGALAAGGGTASGGTARAALSGGSLTLTGPLSLSAFATGGAGMDSSDTGAGGAGGAANNAAGLAELAMPAGSTASFSASGVSASASAFGGAGGTSAAGTADTGGAATAGTARATLADGGFALPGGMVLSANAFGAGGSTGTGGLAAFLLTDTLAAPATTRTIGALQLGAGGNGGAALAGTTAFTAQAGRTASALTLGSLTAMADGTGAPAGNGFVGTFGAVPVSVQGNVFVQTPRDIALITTAGGGINATGAILLNGRSIATSGTGLLSTEASFTAASSGGGIALGAVSAAGSATLTASGGGVSVGNLNAGGTVTANGTGVSIGSTGSLTFAPSAAGNGAFSATAAGDLTFGAVSATGAFTAQAGGTATFGGVAQGTSVAVSSGNIVIGTSGRLGTRGLTQSIVLTNTSPGVGTALGGAAAASGWSLDSAEALRLFADQSITVQAPAAASNPADLTVGALTFAYGANGNVGTGGTFAVATPGRIRVTGAVAPVPVSATDRLSLTAGTLIDVVTDTGSIVLRDGNGALAGILAMTAPTVRIATSAALTALGGITSLSAASQRLDQNDDVINVAGAIQANGLIFTVSGNTLYIQNSGVDTAFANRRGFTANSLAINGLAGALPSFAVNGVINTVAGPQTGLSTYATVLINGAPALPGGAFNPLSTINGCRVGPGCGLPPGQIAPPRETLDPLLGLPGGGGEADARLSIPIVQYGETPLLDSPPLIDEPVTGIGNDDLWQRRCSAQEKDCAE